VTYHVLRPEHGLLQRREWLVPVYPGQTLGVVTVSVAQKILDVLI
jgi:hypothetical protein